MVLTIILAPFVFLTCWTLPFLGTIFSKEHTQKWIAFWILQIASSWTIIPFLGLMVEFQTLMVVKIVIALGLIYGLNDQLTGKLVNKVDGVVSFIKQQKKCCEEKIVKILKQYGLVE